MTMKCLLCTVPVPNTQIAPPLQLFAYNVDPVNQQNPAWHNAMKQIFTCGNNSWTASFLQANALGSNQLPATGATIPDTDPQACSLTMTALLGSITGIQLGDWGIPAVNLDESTSGQCETTSGASLSGKFSLMIEDQNGVLRNGQNCQVSAYENRGGEAWLITWNVVDGAISGESEQDTGISWTDAVPQLEANFGITMDPNNNLYRFLFSTWTFRFDYDDIPANEREGVPYPFTGGGNTLVGDFGDSVIPQNVVFLQPFDAPPPAGLPLFSFTPPPADQDITQWWRWSLPPFKQTLPFQNYGMDVPTVSLIKGNS